ncbi:GNAT family N-acetyltransferase [Streptomyces sp. NPDC088789]|uniref:GNAT family N-acetyltransferase n=1 Tax=Streptomyces sp. NPDC088789 TaxID=3365899 RepID=UPI00381080BD
MVTDPRAFALLAADWADLYRRTPTATPFQSHPWLYSWWLSYGRPGRLRLYLVRDPHGRLVAAAPLMLVHRPLPTLVPLGGAISDYTDVLLDPDPGHGPPAAAALTTALAAAARTALVDFREVRPGAAVERILDRWPGPWRRVTDSVCLELPALPMEELVARLPSAKARQRVRAQLRRLAALGVERRIVGPDDVDRALRRLVELHRLQWQGRKVTGEHLQPRFREHLIRSAGPMVRSGTAVVTEFRLYDEIVAVDLTLKSPSLTGGYLYGAHPRLREGKADVAVMLLDACAEHTRAGDAPGVLSLLRGDEPYKHHWRPEPVVNQRLLLARRPTAPLLATALADAHARRHGKRLLHILQERRGKERGTGGGP